MSVQKVVYGMATTDLGDEGNTNFGCLTAPDTFQIATGSYVVIRIKLS